MPVYRYKTLNQEKSEEFFEVSQKISDTPLKKHPLTGEPVERVLSSPSLTLQHSSGKENKTLSPDHLKKHGFSRYEKDHSSGDYFQTAGKAGPSVIRADEINHSS
jgi:predicted nucleic acid-binding Zn ribbon protein